MNLVEYAKKKSLSGSPPISACFFFFFAGFRLLGTLVRKCHRSAGLTMNDIRNICCLAGIAVAQCFCVSGCRDRHQANHATVPAPNQSVADAREQRPPEQKVTTRSDDIRRLWRFDAAHGSGYFRLLENGKWEEIGGWGEPKLMGVWQELMRTPEYVELYDPKRNYKTRLGDGRAWMTTGRDSTQFGPSPGGKWEQANGVPAVAIRPPDNSKPPAIPQPKPQAPIPAAAANLPPPSPALVGLFEKAVAERDAELQKVRRLLENVEGYLDRVRQARIDPNAEPIEDQRRKGTPLAFESESARLAHVEDLAKEIDRLITGYIGALPKIDLERQGIYSFKVGAIGTIEWPDNSRERSAHILQILGPSEALVEFYTGSEYPSFKVRGVSTAGLVDGKMLPLPGIYEVTGTTTYPTAAGATKTVFVVEPVDLRRIHPLRAKADEAWSRNAAGIVEQGKPLVLKIRKAADAIRPAVALESKRKDELRVEQLADARLTMARSLLNDGKRDKARQKLEEIVKEFPKTKAAVTAAELLKDQ